MNYTISKTEHTKLLTIQKTIQVNKAKLWTFLTTAAGYKQWFPEIKAENLPQSQQLTFEMKDFKEALALINYEENQQVSFKWG